MSSIFKPAQSTIRRSTVAVALVVNAVGVLLMLYFLIGSRQELKDASDNWLRIVESTDIAAQQLSDMRASAGYGGFIHQFKNFVLRRDDSYYISAVASYDLILVQAESLCALITEDEREQLDVYLGTIALYREQLERARDNGEATAEVLDRLVVVDDSLALVALSAVDTSVKARHRTALSEFRKALEETQRFSGLGYVVLIALLVGLGMQLSLLMRFRQQALTVRESTANLTKILERFPTIILWRDAETGRIVYANEFACEKLGYTLDELVTMTSSDLIPQQHRQVHESIVHGFAHGDENYGISTRQGAVVVCADGTQLPIEIHMSRIKIGGRLITVHLLLDLTERISNENKIRSAQKMQAVGQLTAGIAHDFNNILQAISGSAQLLPSVSDPERIAAIIEERVARAASLTARLLAFSGRQALQPELVDPEQLLSDVVDVLKDTFRGSVQVVMQFNKPLPPVFMDKGQLETAIINIGLNARDAMPSGGKLFIEARVLFLEEPLTGSELEGDVLLISVTDTGTGIDDSVLPNVLEPYFTTRTESQHSGLGLSQVHGFVKQSGGALVLKSDVGVGTVVSLYFPVADDAMMINASRQAASKPPAASVSQGEASDAIQQAESAGSDLRILVVEDEKPIQDVASKMLSLAGYQVEVADSADEALEILSSGARFDLLFTDIMMPGTLNGISLVKRVMPEHPELKVLFTSGYAEELIEDSSILDQTGGLLRKPYRREELLSRVEHVLNEPGA